MDGILIVCARRAKLAGRGRMPMNRVVVGFSTIALALSQLIFE